MAKKTKQIKKKEHEKLSDANIAFVKSRLEEVPPITKKEACELLNIAYNTSRLGAIIESYVTRKEIEAKRRAANKNKPATEDEIKFIVIKYLDGETVSEIADSLYRPTAFVHRILEQYNVPKKLSKEASKEVPLLPDNCVASEFNVGEIVWSAKHNAPCRILKEMTNLDYEDKYASKCYSVYVQQPPSESEDIFVEKKLGGYYAYTLAYELGSLQHLKDFNLGITI